MVSEEELQKQVEAQARRVLPETEQATESSVEAVAATMEQELRLAKEERERKIKYSDDSND